MANAAMIGKVKAYLHVDDDADDALLSDLIDAARAYVEDYTGTIWADVELPPAIWSAIMVIVSYHYSNRDAQTDGAQKAAYGCASLLCWPYRSPDCLI